MKTIYFAISLFVNKSTVLGNYGTEITRNPLFSIKQYCERSILWDEGINYDSE